MIVYANYGEPNARIIHGRDHDFPDLRTHEHNRFIEQKIQELAADARSRHRGEGERGRSRRIKAAIREYYLTKNEAREEGVRGGQRPLSVPLLPGLERAEARERARAAAASAARAAPPIAAAAEEAGPVDVVYPLDAELREQVLEIERMIEELNRDLEELRAQRQRRRHPAPDLPQARRAGAGEPAGAGRADFNARRLEMTRNSLLTTWRQVRSRLRLSCTSSDRRLSSVRRRGRGQRLGSCCTDLEASLGDAPCPPGP